MKITDDYARTITKTTGMFQDRAVGRLAKKHGLHVLDITWEDTARFDFSAVGPNISDMTIQVQHQIPGREDYELSCMPVIRYPNFSDISGDISPDAFFLLVGNEKGGLLATELKNRKSVPVFGRSPRCMQLFLTKCRRLCRTEGDAPMTSALPIEESCQVCFAHSVSPTGASACTASY